MPSRRSFLKQSAAFSALSLSGIPYPNQSFMSSSSPPKPIRISAVNSNFEREPLRKPFGFKGSAMTHVWQTAARLRSESGMSKIGLGTQNVLWSDARVFAAHSENGGNALMYAMSEYALQMLKGREFRSPIELLDDIFEEVHAYGKTITQHPDLRKTFALNALVAVDNAAWLLYGSRKQHHFF